MDGAPGAISNDRLSEESCNDAAQELRGPVQESFDGVDALGDPNADGDRGIVMAAGDVAHCRNHNADREAVRERDAEKAQAAGAVQVLIRADGAGAKENQGKCADEFRYEFLRNAVHGDSSQDGKENAHASNGCILAAMRRGKPVPEEDLRKTR